MYKFNIKANKLLGAGVLRNYYFVTIETTDYEDLRRFECVSK